MNPQTHGMEQIEGTYLFDLRTSNRALRLNRFFWHMIRALWRDRFAGCRSIDAGSRPPPSRRRR